MKKQFLMAAAAVAILSFSSCKKDAPDAVIPNPGITKQLKKVTKTEVGIVTVYNLTYDAANRLSAYKSTDNSEYMLFSYDATGNLVKIEQRDHEFKNIYAYTYTNNIPVSGTFKSWQLTAGQPDNLIEDDKLTYTVTNNQVSKIKLVTQNNIETNLSMIYTNGNLTKVTSEGIIIYIATFTFGNKKSLYPKLTNYVLDQAGFSLLFAANNEMLSASYDFPGTTNDFTVNNTYTYDSNGYVLTGNDGDAQSVYEY